MENAKKALKNEYSLSASAFERRAFKLSENGFKLILSLKLRELEHFEISEKFRNKLSIFEQYRRTERVKESS